MSMLVRLRNERGRPAAGALAVLAVAAAAALSACGSAKASGSEPDASGVTTLRYQGWANQVTLPEVAEHLGYFDGKIKLKWVGNTISGPQDIQSAATGETEFGGAFGGAVEKLVSSGAGIKAVINYYGSDAKEFTGYYVLDGSPLKEPRELVGKKVGVNTLGGQNEADIFNVLHKAGLSPADIKKVELVTLPPPNAEDALRKGQIDAVALSGQFRQRAEAAGGVRTLFTHKDLYGPVNGGQYVFRNDFIKKNPAAVRAFVDGVGKAIEWERTTPRDEVVATFTKIVEARARTNESTASLKYWQSVGVPSHYGYIVDGDFALWQDWLITTGSVKQAPKPSDLYTNEFNPNATSPALPAGAKG
ncbi:ABC transporter substrate-binding protein [Dactylosporangium fulvum]|uniref:ABC transporter substrate-binding protein n=1 Tax=Dactylosporangium fulvum TaxID=53359 RepID=A0ABY5VZ64_9ACTN|nr:ABC transporter substrate-binding protein [Dactylosporangium fulvum]UWP82156.1 ABC transporter substrate-binding protein [Dactylosporangium fulvum]